MNFAWDFDWDINFAYDNRDAIKINLIRQCTNYNSVSVAWSMYDSEDKNSERIIRRTVYKSVTQTKIRQDLIK